MTKFFKYLYHGYHETRYLMLRENPTQRFIFVRWVVWEIKEQYYRTRCKVSGHNWRDESHAGPDSGNVYLVCDRCGESHMTWLY